MGSSEDPFLEWIEDHKVTCMYIAVCVTLLVVLNLIDILLEVS